MNFPVWSHHRHRLSADTSSRSLWSILSSPWEITPLGRVHTQVTMAYVFTDQQTWPLGLERTLLVSTGLDPGFTLCSHRRPSTHLLTGACLSPYTSFLYLWMTCGDNESTVGDIAGSHMCAYSVAVAVETGLKGSGVRRLSSNLSSQCSSKNTVWSCTSHFNLSSP